MSLDFCIICPLRRSKKFGLKWFLDIMVVSRIETQMAIFLHFKAVVLGIETESDLTRSFHLVFLMHR